MSKIEYDVIEGKETISDELKELLGSDISEMLEYSNNVRIRTVESPFIIANNFFDLREANNTLEEYNVTQVRMVTFTGGSMFTEYEKNGDDSYIIFGNQIEGFNIFNLI
jgi:hypothetical protein